MGKELKLNWKKWMEKTSRTWMYLLGVVAFVLAFSVVAYYTPIKDVWMPPSMDSDEVMYNRQVVGIVEHGGLQGYFGYDESHARVGRYGGWGPLVIWAYALPGLLFGSSVNTMFWCNLLFGIAGLVLFARAARLNVWQSLVTAGLMVCLWYPLTAMFTGSAAALHNALALAVVGASAALYRRDHPGWLAVAAVACAISTISRTYEVLLWIFPLAALWHTGRRRRWACIGMAAVSFLAALFNMTDLTAPYFDGDGLDIQALTLLAKGNLAGALAYQWEHVDEQLRIVRSQLLALVRGEHPEIGLAVLGYLVFLVITAVVLACDLRRKRPVRFKACALLNAVICGAMLIVVYNVIARHLVLCSLLMAAALVIEDARAGWIYLPVAAVLLLPVSVRRDSLPTYFPLMGEQIEQVETALTESLAARNSSDPWDATLAYAYDDGVIHGYLYGVPAGMGIQFDWNTYLADAGNPIYVRYAMVGHGTPAEARLVADGWELLVDAEELAVYERSDK